MSDPIKRVPSQSITLFEKLARAADGFQAEQVLDAALNIAINAVRQSRATRHEAELAWEELAAKAKGNLMDCYDSTGRKKGIYPYHQIVKVPFSDFRQQ
jgi:hypothetical protein